MHSRYKHFVLSAYRKPYYIQGAESSLLVLIVKCFTLFIQHPIKE